MEPMMFTQFFQKFPQKYSEKHVLKSIYGTMEIGMGKFKEDEEDTEYVKDLSKAYRMLEAYFMEKGVDPHQYEDTNK